MRPESTKAELKAMIMDEIIKSNPADNKQLQQLMLQNHKIPIDTTTKILLELQREEKIKFLERRQTYTTVNTYLFSRKAIWYWIIVFLSLGSLISVFSIPVTSYPAVFLRIILGIILVLFLPGYVVIRTYYINSQVTEPKEFNANIIQFTLSLVVSLVIDAIIGLILYFSLGLDYLKITLSLFTIIMVISTINVIRDYKKGH